MMNSKQQAAKEKINELAIELIALINNKTMLFDREVSRVKEIGDSIAVLSHDLKDYQQLNVM